MKLKEEKAVLRPLLDKVLEISSQDRQCCKKKLWADYNSLRPYDKIPVQVTYEGIPSPQWKCILGPDYLQTETELSRSIEFDLRKRIWMAENVPDDRILWPMVMVDAVLEKEWSWGVDFGTVGTNKDQDNPLEAKKIIPAFNDEIDVEKLIFEDMSVDADATTERVDSVRELVEGRLTVEVFYPNLGFSPFDLAVATRGIENILFDVTDVPEKVHMLMEYITSAFEKHHLNREYYGWLNVQLNEDGAYQIVGTRRVNCAYVADDFHSRKPMLIDEWPYFSAQTSSGLGPDMYEEFVHQYNCRLASLFTNGTVYYHGCECLDQKMNILKTLPNLRRFHISPWSSLEKAVKIFDDSVALEVHSHPTKVFFEFDTEQIKCELQQLIAAANGRRIDLNLSDIHSLNNNPQKLIIWANQAQELSNF